LAGHGARAERLQAAARSVDRPPLAREWRSALPERRSERAERRSEPHCSAAVRYAAVAALAYPHLRPGVAAPKVQFGAQFGSAALRRARRPLPEARAWCPGEAAPEQVHFSARLSAEAARQARRSVRPVASAGQASALPPEEPAVWDVAAPRPEAVRAWVAARQREARDAKEVPPQEAEVWGAAEGPRQAVEAWVGAAAPRPEAASAEARQQEGRDAEVLLPAAPGAQAARLSAAPWAGHRGRLRRGALSPAPQPAAHFVRATEGLRIASP
jgi:hypothetical protein